MLHDPAAVRAAFDEAATTFLSTVRAVDAEAWDRPAALGEWTVRELTAHTLRAFSTIEGYLGAEPAVDRVLADAAEYYQTVLADPQVHHGVAARAKEAGRQLSDPVGEAETTVGRVAALVAATADDEPLNTFAGQITLAEYLVTRVVELGVHTLDLQRATGQPLWIHPATSTVVLHVLTELGSHTTLVLALTGRAALPPGFNALA